MIPIIDNFQVNANKPIDSRMIVANQAARLALAYKYDGLETTQLDTKEKYRWNESTSEWVNITSGSGSSANGTGEEFYVAIWSSMNTLTKTTLYFKQDEMGIGTNVPKGSIHIGTVTPLIFDNKYSNSIRFNSYFDTTNKAITNNVGSAVINFANNEIQFLNRMASATPFMNAIRFGVGEKPLVTPNGYLTHNSALGINTTGPIRAIFQMDSNSENTVPITMDVDTKADESKVGYVAYNYYLSNNGTDSYFSSDDSTFITQYSSPSNQMLIKMRRAGSTVLKTVVTYKLDGSDVAEASFSDNVAIGNDILLLLPTPFPQNILSLKTNLKNLKDSVNSNTNNISNLTTTVNNLESQISNVNIYNTNGTLAGDRIVAIATYSLTIGDTNTTSVFIKNGEHIALNTPAGKGVQINTQKGSGFSTTFYTDLLTADHVVHTPNQSGTMALLENIVKANWEETNSASPSFILNKPDFTVFKTFYVNANNPNNGNGSSFSPFQSIDLAYTAIIGTGSAIAPQFPNMIVYVMPGVYNTNLNIFIKTINWFFEDGAYVNYTGTEYFVDTSAWDVIIAGTFIISGNMTFFTNTGGFIRNIGRSYSVAENKFLDITIKKATGETKIVGGTPLTKPFVHIEHPESNSQLGYTTPTLTLRIKNRLASMEQTTFYHKGRVSMILEGIGANANISYGRTTTMAYISGLDGSLYYMINDTITNSESQRGYLASLTIKNIDFTIRGGSDSFGNVFAQSKALYFKGDFGQVSISNVFVLLNGSGDQFGRVFEFGNITKSVYSGTNGSFILDNVRISKDFVSSDPTPNPVFKWTGVTSGQNKINMRNCVLPAPLYVDANLIANLNTDIGLNTNVINGQLNYSVQLTVYANNAAAITGGLKVGDTYKKSDGSLTTVV